MSFLAGSTSWLRLFALSLDLILGYAGIVSLGHAAFFGIGAYTAGLLAVHGWHEPISGLVAAARTTDVTPARSTPDPEPASRAAI